MLEFCHCWCFMMLKFCDFYRFCWKQYWRCLCAWVEWIETTMYSCVTFILFCIILLRSAAAVTCGWDNGLVPQQPGFYSDYGAWSLVVEWGTAHRTVPLPVWQKSCTLQMAHPCSIVDKCLVLKSIFFNELISIFQVKPALASWPCILFPPVQSEYLSHGFLHTWCNSCYRVTQPAVKTKQLRALITGG